MPKMVEIFLHATNIPDHMKDKYPESVKGYQKALFERLTENSFVFSSRSWNDLELIMSLGKFTRAITTHSHLGNIRHSGFLPKSQMPTIEELAAQEQLNINGLEYGLCPDQLIYQLLYFRKTGQYFPYSNPLAFSAVRQEQKDELAQNLPPGWKYSVVGAYYHQIMPPLDELTLALTKNTEIYLINPK